MLAMLGRTGCPPALLLICSPAQFASLFLSFSLSLVLSLSLLHSSSRFSLSGVCIRERELLAQEEQNGRAPLSRTSYALHEARKESIFRLHTALWCSTFGLRALNSFKFGNEERKRGREREREE